MSSDVSWLRKHLRDVPDFPRPGITFKDITPLLGDAEALRTVVDVIAASWADASVQRVAGIEARGFLLAAPVACRMGVGVIPIRKPGKLPRPVATQTYDLEYGTDAVDVHLDAVDRGDRVLVVDDVLATGGTVAAACDLLEGIGATVVGAHVLLELGFLSGRARLGERDVRSLLVEA